MVVKIIRKVALATMIAAGFSALAIPAASAGPRGAYVVGPAPAPVEFFAGFTTQRSHPRPVYHRRDRGCSPREAVRKASRVGMRNPRVVDVSRREIAVAGRLHRDRAVIRIADRPSCPIRNIRTR